MRPGRRHEGREIDLLAVGRDAGAFEHHHGGFVETVGDRPLDLQSLVFEDRLGRVRSLDRHVVAGERVAQLLDLLVEGGDVGEQGLDRPRLVVERRGAQDLEVVLRPDPVLLQRHQRGVGGLRRLRRIDDAPAVAEAVEGDVCVAQPLLGLRQLGAAMRQHVVLGALGDVVHQRLGPGEDVLRDRDRVVGVEGAHAQGHDTRDQIDMGLDVLAPVLDQFLDRPFTTVAAEIITRLGAEYLRDLQRLLGILHHRLAGDVVGDDVGVLVVVLLDQARELAERNAAHRLDLATHREAALDDVLVGGDGEQVERHGGGRQQDEQAEVAHQLHGEPGLGRLRARAQGDAAPQHRLDPRQHARTGPPRSLDRLDRLGVAAQVRHGAPGECQDAADPVAPFDLVVRVHPDRSPSPPSRRLSAPRVRAGAVLRPPAGKRRVRPCTTALPASGAIAAFSAFLKARAGPPAPLRRAAGAERRGAPAT
ncbi:hypothetical protein [Methylobacterium oryzihabitans]|uniref:Uncharacterized protein n=1 Tax=Methylobacterium oryzihabitans TaxID=2499852 RepID=A0A3S2VTC2_9HYPH|nr:hypothetical protein [Methylobacterium oryzihabitans]RVU20600.1 hypothetical protein EOE48_04405 [Methylobacterium oryzihabitans]